MGWPCSMVLHASSASRTCTDRTGCPAQEGDGTRQAGSSCSACPVDEHLTVLAQLRSPLCRQLNAQRLADGLGQGDLSLEVMVAISWMDSMVVLNLRSLVRNFPYNSKQVPRRCG